MSADGKPLLFDSFRDTIFNKYASERTPEMINMRRVAEASHVFELDGGAVDRLADVVREVPDLLVKHQEFARCPFPQMWVEFDFRRFWERVTGRKCDPTADKRLAYSFHNDTVMVCGGDVTGDGRKFAGALPIVYRLHDPWTMDEELFFAGLCGISRAQFDAFLWGETVLKLDDEGRRALRAQHSFVMSEPFKSHPEAARQMFETVYNGSAGDLRNIVALLLMLNRPQVTHYIDVPRRRGFLRGKLRPFMAHTVVRINVDPVPHLRAIGTPEGDAAPRRRHEVRGHYCHDAIARRGGCDHDWREDPDYEPDAETGQCDNWKCARCGGKRWWRRHHLRGSAVEGWTDRERYVVTGNG